MNKEDEIDKMIEAEINGEETENVEDVENIEEVENEEADVDIEWVSDEEKKTKKKNSKKSVMIYNIVRYAIMGIALIVFGYAAYQLTLIYVESRDGKAIKDEVSDMFRVDIDDLIANNEIPTNSDGETLISLENEKGGELFVFDYDKMLSYNSHAQGYIRQGDGEYIDNPILQHPDNNEYYLTHLVDHRYSTIGSIYIDSSIDEGLNAKNCIIYGHNINDRAGRIMFGSLNWYYNQTGYYEEHPTFDIWVGDTRYRYYVFAIYKTDAVGSPVYQYAFSSDEEFMNYVSSCLKKSKYKFKQAPEITKDSYLITLSTCTHTDEMRMIVQLVRGEELDMYGNPVVREEQTGEETTTAAQ